MINLLIISHDPYRYDKFANQKRKGVISGKNVFPLVCSKSRWQLRTGPDSPPGLDLAGPDRSRQVQTGPDMSGHVWIPTFS